MEKLEREINAKKVMINQFKAKMQQMEKDEQQKQKMLLLKRKQIEDEKSELRKKHADRQRSMTRSNLSTSRLQHILESKQSVIETER